MLVIRLLLGLCFIGAVASWFGSLILMFRYIRFSRPGIDIWRDTNGNPSNLQSDQLTPPGRKYR